MLAGQGAHVYQADVLQHVQVRERRAGGTHLRARARSRALPAHAQAASPRQGRARESLTPQGGGPPALPMHGHRIRRRALLSFA